MRLFPSRRPGRVAATAAAVLAAVTLAATPAAAEPAVTVGPGAEIDVIADRAPTRTGEQLTVDSCTLGFVALKPNGQRVGVTAGHCGPSGRRVAAPVVGEDRTVVEVGTVEQSTYPPGRRGNDAPVDPLVPDWATITFDRGVPVSNRLGRVTPRTIGRAQVGERVCRQGRTSGWQCGRVLDVAGARILTDIAARSGDSGGPLVRLSDGAALGITSLSSINEQAMTDNSQYWDIGYIFTQAGGLRLAS